MIPYNDISRYFGLSFINIVKYIDIIILIIIFKFVIMLGKKLSFRLIKLTI